MQVRFLLGPAGSGKTFRCLEEIRSALLRSPEGLPLVLLAPKQATYQLERALLSHPELPGYTRLQILSFERLAEFVLEEFLASAPRILSNEARVMVLRAVLGQRCADLKLFRATARLPGFAQELSTLFAELQAHQLSPEHLAALSAKPIGYLSEKLHDLALLLRAYLDWLSHNKLQDAGGLLNLAAQAVKQAIHKNEFRLEGLWLDGFAAITPQEMELLAAIVPGCSRATLAFCLDDPPDLNDDWPSMWSTVSETFSRCKTRLETLPQVETTTQILARHPERSRFAGNAALSHLERHWAAPRPFPARPPSSVLLHACADPEAEAVAAAREILQHTRERGGRFRDCAVLVRSLEGYDPALRRVLTRYEIPFFIDRREPVSHHPLAELTRYALRLAIQGWEHDDWFGALKTGLAHREPSDIDWLENEALARGWKRVWEAPIPVPRDPDLEKRVEQLRQKIAPPFSRFVQALNAGHREPTGVQLTGAIRALWDDLEVGRRLQQWSEPNPAPRPGTPGSLQSREIHALAWEEMTKWLDGLELAFEHTALPLANWLPVMEAGLAGLTVGVVPPALDQVLIGAVDRSRNPDLRLVLVLGLNEGVFPAHPPAPVLLNEGDREILHSSGVSLGANQRQRLGFERYLGYIAVTRARERVVLTYALHDSKGAVLNPSPFIAQHLQRLFPGLEATPAGGTVEWQQSLHANELIVPLIKNRRSSGTRRLSSLAALEELPLFAPVLARSDHLAAARAQPQLSPGFADQLYGPELHTSVSALEDYAACPFKFFIVRGLRAQERRTFEADPRERGSFQHEVLMEFHRHLQAQGKRWRDVPLREARKLVEQVGQKVQENFRDGLFLSTPERRFAARLLIENLQRLIGVLISWAPQYDFEPRAVELSFGMDETDLGPWRLPLDAKHSLVLRGRIDRVDLHPHGDDRVYAVVIDYKSSGQAIEPVKLHFGLDLQLLAYLGVLAASPRAEQILGRDKVIPAGAFYVSLRNSAASGKTRAEVIVESQAARPRMEGYQHRGRFDAERLPWFDNRKMPKGDQFRYSLNKNGGLAKIGNDAMPAQEFTSLLERIAVSLREYGQKIYAGDVSVAPYRFRTETACDRCDYRAICRFDPWIEPYRVLKLRPEEEE